MIRRTANLLICNGKNISPPHPPTLQSNGRKGKKQNQQCCLFRIFLGCYFSFLFIPGVVIVAGAGGGDTHVIAVIYLYFYDGLTTQFFCLCRLRHFLLKVLNLLGSFWTGPLELNFFLCFLRAIVVSSQSPPPPSKLETPLLGTWSVSAYWGVILG